MVYVLRETDAPVRVVVDRREGGYVYYRHVGGAASTTARLTEAKFAETFIDEALLRLEEV
jgi:hypothetical protein